MKREKAGCQDLKDSVVAKKDAVKKPNGKDRKWEAPVLEDVSGRVMAQPYIRFT